jgi:hypothetical protein
MGLRRIGGMVDLSPSSDGGGGGDAMDPVTGGQPSGPLSPDLGARVLVGRLCSRTWILAVKCPNQVGACTPTMDGTQQILAAIRGHVG